MGHTSNIAIIILLIACVVYRRLKRTIGFQLYAPRKLWTRVILLSLVSVLVLAGTLQLPLNYSLELLGALIGVGLSVYSMRTSVFESRDGGMYYKPNTWIGLTVFAVFVGRFAYRFIQMSQMTSTPANNANAMAYYYRDKYTAMLFFVVAIFYIVYYLLIIRRHASDRHNDAGQAAHPSE